MEYGMRERRRCLTWRMRELGEDLKTLEDRV